MDKMGVHGHGHTDSDLKTLLAFILCDGAPKFCAAQGHLVEKTAPEKGQKKGKNDQVCIGWKKLRQGALVNTN